MTSFYIAVHALIRRKDEFLLLRRAGVNDYMPKKWDIPGGTVEVGETVESALEREVLEETGLRVQPVRLLHAYTNRDQIPERQTFQLVYLADYLDGEVELNPLEHDEWRWCKKADIYAVDAIAFLESLRRSREFEQALGDSE